MVHCPLPSLVLSGALFSGVPQVIFDEQVVEGGYLKDLVWCPRGKSRCKQGFREVHHSLG